MSGRRGESSKIRNASSMENLTANSSMGEPSSVWGVSESIRVPNGHTRAGGRQPGGTAEKTGGGDSFP